MADRPGSERPGNDPAPDADELRRRHEAYIWRVNAAVAAGRESLARELADTYLDECLEDQHKRGFRWSRRRGDGRAFT